MYNTGAAAGAADAAAAAGGAVACCLCSTFESYTMLQEKRLLLLQCRADEAALVC